MSIQSIYQGTPSHLSVALKDDDGAPILDATVTAKIKTVDGTEVQTFTPAHTSGGVYRSDLTDEFTSTLDVTFYWAEVSASAGGLDASKEFLFRVYPPRS